MTGYTAEEVARLLGLSTGQIRSYTRAGFLSPSPARAARGELRFSFQDLVLLRAAKGLMAARIPAAKIRGSLRRLKQQLPRGRALSELRITAEGHRVVARDGALAWNPDSGQLVLDFDVASLAERAAPLARRQAATRSEEHTSELQSQSNLVCRLLLEKKKKKTIIYISTHKTYQSKK